jgi:hypothetical protein
LVCGGLRGGRNRRGLALPGAQEAADFPCRVAQRIAAIESSVIRIVPLTQCVILVKSAAGRFGAPIPTQLAAWKTAATRISVQASSAMRAFERICVMRGLRKLNRSSDAPATVRPRPGQ